MSDRLLVATRKALLTVDRQRKWTVTSEHHLGIAVSYAVADPRDGTIFACLADGHFGPKLQRSRDAGQTWQELPAPSYPEGAELKPGQPATLNYQWCLVPGPEDRPGRLYMGTEPGGLFVSDDRGDSFELVQSLWDHPSRQEDWMGGGFDNPGIHSVEVDPRDSDRVVVGVSVAGVFASGDGGSSWQPRNRGLRADYLPNPDVEIGHDPHLLVQCRSQPDVLWQQNHCGVFRSVDGGLNWADVSQPEGAVGFGFAVAVDPDDGQTAWVVPAVNDDKRVAVDRQLRVSRTTDGGASWIDFRDGLPQQDCFDFAFRHGLDLRGPRLALGTACGSLYVSEDRGESWTAVAHHLPPIYSVRFA